MSIEEELLDDFSGGVQTGESPDEFSRRQWERLYGVVFEDERRLRTQPHRALFRSAIDAPVDVGIIQGAVDNLIVVRPNGTLQAMPIEDLGEDPDPAWTAASSVTLNGGDDTPKILSQVPRLADDTWRSAVLLNTVFPTEAENAYIAYIDSLGEVAVEVADERYPTGPSVNDAMPYGNVSAMWGDFLVLGDIRWIKDQGEAFSESNSTRFPHGLWFSQPTSITNWDPIDVEFVGHGRGDRAIVGLFPIDVGLVVLATDGAHLLRGNPIAYQYESLRAGIGPVSPEACTFWPHQGVVTWLDSRGRAWWTDGDEVDRYDRPLPESPASGLETRNKLRIANLTGRVRADDSISVVGAGAGFRWEIELALDNWTTATRRLATFADVDGVRRHWLGTDGSGRPTLTVEFTDGGDVTATGASAWPFANGVRAEVRVTARGPIDGQLNGLVQIEAREVGDEDWDVLASSTPAPSAGAPVGGAMVPIIGHLPEVVSKGMHIDDTDQGASTPHDSSFNVTDLDARFHGLVDVDGFKLGSVGPRKGEAWNVSGINTGSISGRVGSVTLSGLGVPVSHRWRRITYVASTGQVQLLTSLDGEAWTVRDEDTAASLPTNTVNLEVRSSFLEPHTWRIFEMQLRDGINGTLVANPRFDQESAGTTPFDDAQGNTWTFNNGAEIVDDGVPQAPVDGFVGDVYRSTIRRINENGTTVGISTVAWALETDWPAGNTFGADEQGRQWAVAGNAEVQFVADIVLGFRLSLTSWHDALVAERGGRLWALRAFEEGGAWTELAWPDSSIVKGLENDGALYALTLEDDAEDAREIYRLDPDHPDRGNVDHVHVHTRPLGTPHRKTFWHRIGVRYRGPGELATLAVHLDRGELHAGEIPFAPAGEDSHRAVVPAPGPSREMMVAAEFEGDVIVESLSAWFHQGRDER